MEFSIHFGEWTASGRKREWQARQWVFCSALNPLGQDTEEEPRSFLLHCSSKTVLWNTLEQQSRCCILDKFVKSAGSRITILADKIMCNHYLHYSARETSQNADRGIFKRLATPRPAPKVTLKSNWQTQQQQQQPQQPTLEDDGPGIWKQRATWESRTRVRDDTKHAMEVERPSKNWCLLLLKRKLILISLEKSPDEYGYRRGWTIQI